MSRIATEWKSRFSTFSGRPACYDPQMRRTRSLWLNGSTRSPEAQAVLTMHLELLIYRTDIVAEYRRRGAKGMTFLDYVILFFIHTFQAEGVRQQNLIDAIGAARSTIRDSLARLERNELVVRMGEDGETLYYCAPGAITESDRRDVFARVERISEALAAAKRL